MGLIRFLQHTIKYDDQNNQETLLKNPRTNAAQSGLSVTFLIHKARSIHSLYKTLYQSLVYSTVRDLKTHWDYIFAPMLQKTSLYTVAS